MGMDVYGKNPKSEVGRYFRSNVWWWHPLAAYVVDVAPQIASKCVHWHSNEGDGLGAVDSRKLAAALREEIASGRTATFAMEYQANLDAIPRKRCELCNGTGIRCDEIGVESGMPERVIDEPGHPRHGQKGYCNGCHGKGECDNPDTWYPFSVENVQEFAEFLEQCGGFKIY